jgi:hypothetical protein
MQLGEHERTPDEKQTHRLLQPYLVQFLTKISQVRFNITRSHRFLSRFILPLLEAWLLSSGLSLEL